MNARIGTVVIGRNEGARLIDCLTSLTRQNSGRIVYVDSGSVDDSVAAAKALGVDVARLDLTATFTAARARNEGLRRLLSAAPTTDYVQFIDGDCALAPGWLAAAEAFLDGHADVAVVCGRRRERRPEASLYNRLCDIEWATPPGEAQACGGDALMRTSAVVAVGGYRDGLVAGEEPELCVRLREAGWRIWRLDAEMTLHDAAISSFAQWWRRNVRAGHAFAEVSSLHARSDRRIWRKETIRALAWPALLPVALLGGLAVHPILFAACLAYPAQAGRLWWRESRRLGLGPAALHGLFTTLGKFPEAQGVLRYYWARIVGVHPRLIEYK